MSPPSPPLKEINPTLRWSVALTARPRGFSLAREPHTLLTWDDQGWLTLVGAAGKVQGKVQPHGTVTATAAADDGSAFAAVGAGGEVRWLAPDLMPRWDQTLPTPAVSAAMDAHGCHLAVGDARGNLHVFDRRGKSVVRLQSPRAVHHLAFVPEVDRLVAAADFGLVTAYDLAGRSLWQDRLVAHLGSLATDGPGDRVILACFTDGLRFYDRAGNSQGAAPLPEPCRLVAMSYTGDRLVASGLEQRLYLLDRGGAPRMAVKVAGPAVALAMGALGRSVVVGFADGRVLGLDLPDR
jgi:hypothetical protein